MNYPGFGSATLVLTTESVISDYCAFLRHEGWRGQPALHRPSPPPPLQGTPFIPLRVSQTV
jgi:hypothetical protein